MSTQDGKLVLPDGMQYRILCLPPTRLMTPKLLKRIEELVWEGATAVGPQPVASASLSNYPECDRIVRKLAAELWGKCDGVALKENRYGKGSEGKDVSALVS